MPINNVLNGEVIAHIVNHTVARVFITEDSLYHAVQGAKERLTAVHHQGWLPLSGAEAPAGYINLESALRGVSTDIVEYDVSAEDIAQIPNTNSTEPHPPRGRCSRTAL